MEDPLVVKKKLYALCQKGLEERMQAIRTALKEAQDSANVETKSSAGDKHETGRAMMQLETEQLSTRMREVLSEQDRLQRVPDSKSSRIIEPGALVFTDTLKLYFAVSVGKLLLDGEEYFALSLQTPLGMVAHGRQEGDTFAFQRKEYRVNKIF